MSNAQHFSHWPTWALPVLSPPPALATADGETCQYLPGRAAAFRAFHADQLSADAYQACMDAGFRRSGGIIYQPACPSCRECVPLRVEVNKLALSKSQRRVLRKKEDLLIRVAPPEPSAEKWNLYCRYQRDWHGGGQPTTAADFIRFLYQSPVNTIEFEYRDSTGALLGVGICDISPNSLSSVYFYFDPTHRRRSLGTFSALYEMQWARDRRIPFWYAGYWVRGCRSMDYKSRFQPAEILGTDGQWRAFDDYISKKSK